MVMYFCFLSFSFDILGNVFSHSRVITHLSQNLVAKSEEYFAEFKKTVILSFFKGNLPLLEAVTEITVMLVDYENRLSTLCEYDYFSLNSIPLLTGLIQF